MNRAAGEIDVVDTGDGVIRASVEASFVRRDLAERLCTAIEDAARAYPSGAKLVMDMGALSKASPAAGLYAMRSMKALGLAKIALVGGNAFMRGFAKTVMTLARFRSFAFFSSEPGAIGWVRESD